MKMLRRIFSRSRSLSSTTEDMKVETDRDNLSATSRTANSTVENQTYSILVKDATGPRETIIENLEFTHKEKESDPDEGYENDRFASNEESVVSLQSSRRSSMGSYVSFASSLTFDDDSVSYTFAGIPSGRTRRSSLTHGGRRSSLTHAEGRHIPAAPRSIRRASLAHSGQMTGRRPSINSSLVKKAGYRQRSFSLSLVDDQPCGRFRQGSESSESAPKVPSRSRSPDPRFEAHREVRRGQQSHDEKGQVAASLQEMLPVEFKPLRMSQATADECATYGYEEALPDLAVKPNDFGIATATRHLSMAAASRPLVVGRGAAPRRSSMKHRTSSSSLEDEHVRTPRRASIQVGGDYQTSCEIRRASIEFAEKEEVTVIEPIKKLMDHHDPSNYWYNKEEIRDMRKESKLLVKQEALGVLSPRECLRGLESNFTPGYRIEKQKKVWESVLALQHLQQQTGRKDVEYLRRLSMFYTREAMETATQRGIEDAVEIRQYLNETQKKIRRRSML